MSLLYLEGYDSGRERLHGLPTTYFSAPKRRTDPVTLREQYGACSGSPSMPCCVGHSTMTLQCVWKGEKKVVGRCSPIAICYQLSTGDLRSLICGREGG